MGGEEEEKKDAEPEAAPKEEAMARADPRAAHVDDQEFKGFESTPALYLRSALTSEFFGDSIKQRIIAIEFTGPKGQSVNEQLAGAAGFLASGLHTSEREDADAWFSGLVGELDQASLRDLKKDAPISFPGWLAGWASEDDALGYLAALKDEGKKDVSQVVFKVTGAHVTKVLGNRLVAYRPAGKLAEDAKFDDKTNVLTVTVAASPFDDRTLQASHDALNAAPAPAPPVTEEKKEGDPETAPAGEPEAAPKEE